MEVGIEALLTGLPGLRLDGPVDWDVENLPAISPTRVPIAWDPGAGPEAIEMRAG